MTHKGKSFSDFMLTTGVSVAIMESTESGQTDRQRSRPTGTHAGREGCGGSGWGGGLLTLIYLKY